MDYFYVGNHGGSVGLQDVFFKLKYKMGKGFIGVDAHFFSAAADVLDNKELARSGMYKAMSPGFGTEIDLVGGFNLSEGVSLKAGFSTMLATSTLAQIKSVIF